MDLIIFDKDGVLLDLTATWLPVAVDITHHLSNLTNGDVSAQTFQQIIGIDETTGKIDPDGLFAAGSFLDQQSACAERAPLLQDHYHRPAYQAAISEIVERNAQRAPQPLGEIKRTLNALKDEGYQLAVLTNDSEKSARRSFEELGIKDYFHKVVGYDSGYGSKPDPTGFHAICEACQRTPNQAIMIGDTGADRKVAEAANAGLFVGISANYPQPTNALEGARYLLANIEELPDLLRSLPVR